MINIAGVEIALLTVNTDGYCTTSKEKEDAVVARVGHIAVAAAVESYSSRCTQPAGAYPAVVSRVRGETAVLTVDARSSRSQSCCKRRCRVDSVEQYVTPGKDENEHHSQRISSI